MNTGTRLTLLQSKGCNRYAIKTGSGWIEETITEGQPPIRRELSSRRVAAMIDALLSIQRDIDPLDGYQDNHHDNGELDRELDRVFGPLPQPHYSWLNESLAPDDDPGDDDPF